MQQVNIYEAKTHLSKLIAQAQQGHDIIIAKSGKPVVKLTPIDTVRKDRKPGLLKGKIWMSKDMKKVDKEIEDLFYKSKIFPD